MKLHTILYKVLLVRLEGKTHSRRSNRRCEDNIKLDLKDVGLDSVARCLWLSIKTSERIL